MYTIKKIKTLLGCQISFSDTLKKRPGVGVDSLDGFCHEYEHCLECLKIDGCDTETQEFSPTVLPGANFTCENLKGNDCQERYTKMKIQFSLSALFLR